MIARFVLPLAFLVFLFDVVHLYIEDYSHADRRAGHHSSYSVSHHMGKMNIKANPEGADFDFSGGDLHVDLHPGHGDVVPIYNYFHSDYHEDPHYEEEEEMEPHHMQHDDMMMHHHHHSGDDMHHGFRDTMHHGEDEGGYGRSTHHGGMGDHHHMDKHEQEEIAADHGHEGMPHLFPIGVGNVGHHGRHDFHIGHVNEHHGHGGYVGGHMGGHNGGGYGGHHGGFGWGYGGYGKDQVPNTKLPIEKIIPSDESIKAPLDFVQEAEKIQEEKLLLKSLPDKTKNIVPLSLQEQGITSTLLPSFIQNQINSTKNTAVANNSTITNRPFNKMVEFNTDLRPQSSKTVKAITRNFLNPTGSILKDYKKHWDDEEKSENGDSESNDDEEDEDEETSDEDDDSKDEHEVDDNDDGKNDDNDNGKNDDNDDDKNDDDDDDESGPTQPKHPHAHHIHHNHKQRHNVRLEDLPMNDEFMRNHHIHKKIYPDTLNRSSQKTELRGSKSAKLEELKEIIDPEYKINDKVTAQEAQLEMDMQKEKEEEKELSALANHHHKRHRRRHKRHHYHRPERHHRRRRHHKRHHHHLHHHHPTDTRDKEEKKIEEEEKEIQHETEMKYGNKTQEEEDADDAIDSTLHRDDDDDGSESSDKDSHHRRHHGKNEDDEKEDKYAGNGDEMDDEDRRQHSFHNSISQMHNLRKPFHALENPHDGEEKFEDSKEEVQINDKTGEGDVDEGDVEAHLEEFKKKLPLHFGKDGERLRHFGEAQEWGDNNEKENADREMAEHLQQNDDSRLAEGSDHDFYNDHPPSNEGADHQNDHPGEPNDHPEEQNRGEETEEFHGRNTEEFGADRRHLNDATKSASIITSNVDAAKKEPTNSASTTNTASVTLSKSDVFQSLKNEVSDFKKQQADLPLTLNGNVYTALKEELQKEKNKEHSTENDITEQPSTQKLLDEQLLKDFKSRYTEENGFQSAQKADEMFNQLQELAINNQKQIDAHQTTGKFYKSVLKNNPFGSDSSSTTPKVLETAAKRHVIGALIHHRKKRIHKIITKKKPKIRPKKKYVKNKSSTNKQQLKRKIIRNKLLGRRKLVSSKS